MEHGFELFVNYSVQEKSCPQFFISLAGSSYCDGSYFIKRTNSDVLVAAYVDAGEGTIISDGETVCAKEGDLYLLGPGSNHIYYSDSANPWRLVWFNAGGLLVSDFFRGYNPQKKILFSQFGKREYFEKIHAIGDNTVFTAAEKNRKAALVFHEFMQYLYEQFYVQEEDYHKEWQIMKAYLESHLTENISLKDLCQLVYLSESQVIRIFKKNADTTPHQYLLELKLAQSRNLLRSTSLRIQEVSDYLGFCSAHYFSSLFKQKMGMTPMEYRHHDIGE